MQRHTGHGVGLRPLPLFPLSLKECDKLRVPPAHREKYTIVHALVSQNLTTISDDVLRSINRTNFLLKRLRHGGRDHTPFRALCAPVFLRLGTRILHKRTPETCYALMIHRFPRGFVKSFKCVASSPS